MSGIWFFKKTTLRRKLKRGIRFMTKAIRRRQNNESIPALFYQYFTKSDGNSSKTTIINQILRI